MSFKNDGLWEHQAFQCCLVSYIFTNDKLKACLVDGCSYFEEQPRHVADLPASAPAPSSTSCSADAALSRSCSSILLQKMSLIPHQPSKSKAAMPHRQQLSISDSIKAPQMLILIIRNKEVASCLVHWLQYLLKSNCINTVVCFEMWKTSR